MITTIAGFYTWGKAGAAEGIRTPDPRITNAVLYQLSYRGTPSERRSSNTGEALTQGWCRRLPGCGSSAGDLRSRSTAER